MIKKVSFIAILSLSTFNTSLISAFPCEEPDETFSLAKSSINLANGIGFGYLCYKCIQATIEMHNHDLLLANCASLAAGALALNFGIHSLAYLDKALAQK